MARTREFIIEDSLDDSTAAVSILCLHGPVCYCYCILHHVLVPSLPGPSRLLFPGCVHSPIPCLSCSPWSHDQPISIHITWPAHLRLQSHDQPISFCNLWSSLVHRVVPFLLKLRLWRLRELAIIGGTSISTQLRALEHTAPRKVKVDFDLLGTVWWELPW